MAFRDFESHPSVARKSFVLFGRDGGIRTRDPLNPIQVRYQAAPRPDRVTSTSRECLPARAASA
jgi:hypothetical protein